MSHRLRTRVAFVVLGLVCAAAIFGMNLRRFIGAELGIGMQSRLAYLPDPQVARVLAFGHPNSVAKLQWIGSFDYFQYQLRARDDSIPGSERGGFARLYDNLVALDPHYVPFYTFGSTMLSGILQHHEDAYALLEQGVRHHPENTWLWVLLTNCCRLSLEWDVERPGVYRRVLLDWLAAEEAKERGLEYLPRDYLSRLGEEREVALELARHWGVILEASGAGGVDAELTTELLREQLALHGRRRLAQALALWRERHPDVVAEDLAVVADPVILAELYSQPDAARAPSEPFTQDPEGGWSLRSDPFGGAYRLAAGQVVSDGLVLRDAEQAVASMNLAITRASERRGTWPQDLAEVSEWVPRRRLPPVPPTHEVVLVDGRLAVQATQAPEPWPRERLLHAVGLGPAAD